MGVEVGTRVGARLGVGAKVGARVGARVGVGVEVGARVGARGREGRGGEGQEEGQGLVWLGLRWTEGIVPVCPLQWAGS